MRAIAGVVGAALAVCLLALRRCFAVVTVDGPSMWPAFQGGERVLARRCGRSPERGTVVVAEVPTLDDRWCWPAPPTRTDLAGRNWMVKRVVAVAGDRTPERFAEAAGVRPGAPVPAGHVLLAGDNVGASLDSQMFGFVPAARLLGSVVRTLTHRGAQPASQWPSLQSLTVLIR